jgi:IS5 family transposase
MPFVTTHNDGFLGRFAYDQIVPPDSFLRMLRDLINWDQFTEGFVKLYVGKAKHGRPPYHPVIVFKCLLLSYLYNLSERSVEWFCRNTFEGRLFLDVSIADPTPDHSTLSLFRSRIEDAELPEKEESQEERRERIEKQYRVLFNRVLKEASRLGIEWGPIRAADSVHTVANVNNEKDRIRQAAGKPPVDPDATVVSKGEREVTEAGGEVVKRKIRYNGYKMHTTIDPKTRIVTAVKTTPGRAADNEQLVDLMDLDKETGLTVTTYTADRGYDDGTLRAELKKRGLHDALKLNDYRTTKKDANKEIWLALLADPYYQEGLRQRYTVEAKYSEAKAWHGLGRSRYRGHPGHIAQAFFTMMVLNLKRIVLLVTGVTLREASRRRLVRSWA